MGAVLQESSRGAKPSRSSPRVRLPSSSGCHMHITVARHHACRGSLDWPADKRRPARALPSCGASIAIPSATGLRSMKQAAWRRCWTCTCRLGSPCPCPRTDWPAWSRPSGGRRALPPLRRCASGSNNAISCRPLSHALHHGPHPVQRQAQGPAAQPHPKSLRPSGRFRRTVASGCRASSRAPTPTRYGCSARTKAAAAW